MFSTLEAMLEALRQDNPIEYRDAVLEVFPDLLQPFTVSAAELAAAWYEDLRGEAIAGSFAARTAPEVERERLDALVRYSFGPLFGQSASTVLGLLAGGSQRIVENAGRSTIALNAQNDRVRVGFARIPRPGCCAFCGLLASRGAVYGSEASAGQVNKYHDFCRCVVAPAFPGADNGVIEQSRDQFREQYREVAEGGDTKATLAAWRSEFGTR
jgi:hypothetical protein